MQFGLDKNQKVIFKKGPLVKSKNNTQYFTVEID